MSNNVKKSNNAHRESNSSVTNNTFLLGATKNLFIKEILDNIQFIHQPFKATVNKQTSLSPPHQVQANPSSEIEIEGFLTEMDNSLSEPQLTSKLQVPNSKFNKISNYSQLKSILLSLETMSTIPISSRTNKFVTDHKLAESDFGLSGNINTILNMKNDNIENTFGYGKLFNTDNVWESNQKRIYLTPKIKTSNTFVSNTIFEKLSKTLIELEQESSNLGNLQALKKSLFVEIKKLMKEINTEPLNQSNSNQHLNNNDLLGDRDLIMNNNNNNNRNGSYEDRRSVLVEFGDILFRLNMVICEKLLLLKSSKAVLVSSLNKDKDTSGLMFFNLNTSNAPSPRGIKNTEKNDSNNNLNRGNTGNSGLNASEHYSNSPGISNCNTNNLNNSTYTYSEIICFFEGLLERLIKETINIYISAFDEERVIEVKEFFVDFLIQTNYPKEAIIAEIDSLINSVNNLCGDDSLVLGNCYYKKAMVELQHENYSASEDLFLVALRYFSNGLLVIAKNAGNKVVFPSNIHAREKSVDKSISKQNNNNNNNNNNTLNKINASNLSEIKNTNESGSINDIKLKIKGKNEKLNTSKSQVITLVDAEDDVKADETRYHNKFFFNYNCSSFVKKTMKAEIFSTVKYENYLKACNCLFKLGYINALTEYFELSLECFKKACQHYSDIQTEYLDMITERGDKASIHFSLFACKFNYGSIFEKLNKFDLALDNYNLALKHLYNTNTSEGSNNDYSIEQVNLHGRKAFCEYSLKKYSEAENSIQSVVTVISKLKAYMQNYVNSQVGLNNHNQGASNTNLNNTYFNSNNLNNNNNNDKLTGSNDSMVVFAHHMMNQAMIHMNLINFECFLLLSDVFLLRKDLEPTAAFTILENCFNLLTKNRDCISDEVEYSEYLKLLKQTNKVVIKLKKVIDKEEGKSKEQEQDGKKKDREDKSKDKDKDKKKEVKNKDAKETPNNNTIGLQSALSSLTEDLIEKLVVYLERQPDIPSFNLADSAFSAAKIIISLDHSQQAIRVLLKSLVIFDRIQEERFLEALEKEKSNNENYLNFLENDGNKENNSLNNSNNNNPQQENSKENLSKEEVSNSKVFKNSEMNHENINVLASLNKNNKNNETKEKERSRGNNSGDEDNNNNNNTLNHNNREGTPMKNQKGTSFKNASTPGKRGKSAKKDDTKNVLHNSMVLKSSSKSSTQRIGFNNLTTTGFISSFLQSQATKDNCFNNTTTSTVNNTNKTTTAFISTFDRKSDELSFINFSILNSITPKIISEQTRNPLITVVNNLGTPNNNNHNMESNNDDINDETTNFTLSVLFKKIDVLNSIAIEYQKIKQPDKALKYFKQAIIIIKGHFPSELLKLAGIYNNIGLVYDKLNKNREALQMKIKSLRLKQAVYPEDDLKIYESMFGVALQHNKLKQFNEAADLALKIHEAYIKLKGEKCDISGDTALLLGDVFKENGEYDNSIKYNDYAISVFSKFHDSKHYNVIRANIMNAVCFSKLKQYSKTIEIMNLYNKDAKSNFKETSSLYNEGLLALAVSYEESQETKQALKTYEAISKTLKDVGGLKVVNSKIKQLKSALKSGSGMSENIKETVKSTKNKINP